MQSLASSATSAASLLPQSPLSRGPEGAAAGQAPTADATSLPQSPGLAAAVAGPAATSAEQAPASAAAAQGDGTAAAKVAAAEAEARQLDAELENAHSQLQQAEERVQEALSLQEHLRAQAEQAAGALQR